MNLLSNKRLPNETYANYKDRQRINHIALKQHKKGKKCFDCGCSPIYEEQEEEAVLPPRIIGRTKGISYKKPVEKEEE